jgi:DNA helicase HerA-like ATPase
MTDQSDIILGASEAGQVVISPKMANRHGLIAGATGTGKTVTLQIMAENFSRLGVPVFMADVKGDLSGLATPGSPHEKIAERVEKIGLKHQFAGCPTVFWDLYGEKGHPIRTTLSEFGPLLLANFLDLNDNQTGIIYSAFKLADDEGMLMLDLKDLKATLNFLKQERKALEGEYGSLSPASIAAILRKLLAFEQQGGERFFAEPALAIADLMKTDFSGQGVINVLDGTKLIHEPRLYSVFLLWLISELFEQLPEVGDPEKPKLVFFFDEAHLLFSNSSKLLVEKIEQVVRLIRSKGVGVYFISQSPADIPDNILGQLGNRVQHALRAFTPKDQKAVRVAAQTFRPNPSFETETVITNLGVGEALVSTLDTRGTPQPVERCLIAPPQSRIGPLAPKERQEVIARSPYAGRYNDIVDRESAYEILAERAQQMADKPAEQPKTKRSTGRKRQGVFEAMAKSAARSIGSSLGRQIIRGVLGSILKR